MTYDLGYNTERKKLSGLKECEDWLRNLPSNSLKLSFEDGTEFIMNH